MAHPDVVEAVHARLAENWTRCPVLEDLNLEDRKAKASPNLSVLFPVSTSEQLSIGAPGANLWREEGAFILVLSITRGTGVREWLPWGEELAALFRGKSFDGVQTFAPSSAPSDASNDDGSFFDLRVAVPYQFDLIG